MAWFWQAGWIWSEAQVMLSGVASVTVKVAEHASLCPQSSVAVQVTVRDPPQALGAMGDNGSVLTVGLQPPL